MSGHTPGPWKLETVRTSCGLCHKIGPFPWREGQENHACIYDDYPPPGGRPELVANARLIAAAPETAAERDRLNELNAELLETLKDIARQKLTTELDDQGDFEFAYDTIVKIARAALAKAGEAGDG